MEKVVSVKAGPNWTLEVRFSDGVGGTISLADRLFGPVFEPLKDPAFFAQVTIDEFGVICWPNGADLAPDALYETITQESHVA
jgi:hypothetical protein